MPLTTVVASPISTPGATSRSRYQPLSAGCRAGVWLRRPDARVPARPGRAHGLAGCRNPRPTGDAGATRVVRRRKRKAVGWRVAEWHLQMRSASPQAVFAGRFGPAGPAKNRVIFVLAIDSFGVKIKSLPGAMVARPHRSGSHSASLGWVRRRSNCPSWHGWNLRGCSSWK